MVVGAAVVVIVNALLVCGDVVVVVGVAVVAIIREVVVVGGVVVVAGVTVVVSSDDIRQ